MKIRQPAVVRALGFAGAAVVRLWMGSLRCRYRSAGPSVEPHLRTLPCRYIYAVWHENILLPVYRYSRPDMAVLISQHADAGVLTEILRQLQVRVIRGSTTRGGVQAVRRLLRAGAVTHLSITPDGPRGPRRRVQSGIIYLAARMQMPIVPVGFGFQRPWRLQSWDRFVLPRPWTRATCVTGIPIAVPPTADKVQREYYLEQVQAGMAEVTRAAEDWAERAIIPPRYAGPPLPAEPLPPGPLVSDDDTVEDSEYLPQEALPLWP